MASPPISPPISPPTTYKDFEVFKPGDLEIHHVEHARTESSESQPPFAEHGALIDRIPTASTASQPPFAEHGMLIDRSMTAEAKKKAGEKLLWPRIRRVLREPFSEFLGTFIIIMFGDGVVAQVVLSRGKNGDYQSIRYCLTSLIFNDRELTRSPVGDGAWESC